VIDRRTFLAGTGVVVLAAPLAAEAQAPPKIHRIGLLSVPPAYLAAFEESLRQLGYARGRNILFEIPSVGVATEPRTRAAAELVRLNVEVMVTGPNTFIDVARQVTTTVPIVMYGSDRVGRGYIASLARPGGNVIGLTSEPSPEIVGKYVEFLDELSPRPSRVACLVDPATPERPLWKEADTAAKRRGVTLASFARLETAEAERRMFERRQKLITHIREGKAWSSASLTYIPSFRLCLGYSS
jgi:putative ABC transport system substrate-binding protein